MADSLKEGAKAPPIHLQTDADQPFDLSAKKGTNVVLYFYPKADTPGCTVEAHEFDNALSKIAKHDAEVYGISPDTPKAQTKFKEKCGLKLPLLCDVEKKVAEAYGVWVEKSMYGKTYMGIERATFLVDKGGIVRHIWRKVKVENHVKEVLAAVKTL